MKEPAAAGSVRVIGFRGVIMPLNNRIRELRNARSMSWTDLAEAIGISENLMLSYESGMERISMDHVRKMCDLFECTGDYLLGYTPFRRVPELSDDDVLIKAYHAAGDKEKKLVLLILSDYMEEGIIPLTAK